METPPKELSSEVQVCQFRPEHDEPLLHFFWFKYKFDFSVHCTLTNSSNVLIWVHWMYQNPNTKNYSFFIEQFASTIAFDRF